MSISKDMSLKILVMAQVDPSCNPRPFRIINLLRSIGHTVHVASFPIEGKIDLDGHYVVGRPSLKITDKLIRKIVGMIGFLSRSEFIRSHLSSLRWNLGALRKQLKNERFDLIIVEDIYLLPLAFQVKNGAKIIMDAREFYPEELGHSLFWNISERPIRISICRKYLKICDAVMTVSQGLADRYEKDFGVKPFLLRSMPNFKGLYPTPMETGRIRMVHHGVANRDRRLENMIDIMSQLDERYELDIYLKGDESYIGELKHYAKNNSNIHFPPPVAFTDIVPTLNKYDMGFCYLEPTTFNLEHCLPNKFFEFIQARLAILIGPSLSMVPLVNAHQCGFISPSFDINESSAFLNSLRDTDVEDAKQMSHKCAEILCYENESQGFLSRINEMFQKTDV
jgi:hypothetical protein